MNTFLKYFKSQLVVKEEDYFKNQITSYFLFGSTILCLIYVVFGYFYSLPIVLYVNTILCISFVILFALMTTEYTKTIKLAFIIISSTGILIESMAFPKNVLFNILYSNVFFIIFIIYDSSSIKEVVLSVLYMIVSYLYLEYYFINHDYNTLSNTPVNNALIIINGAMFAFGLISCGVFYVYNNKLIYSSITEKENNLAAIIENSQNAIWAADKNLNIISYNENFSRFCEVTDNRKPSIGEPILKYLSKKILSTNDWHKRCKMALTGKKITEELSFIYEKNKIYVEVSLYPILNKKDEIIGIAFFGKDITKRKNYTALLLNKNEELSKANEELDQLVYRASHDLKAPLMSILGLINVTEIEIKEKIYGLDKNFEMMRKSVQRLDGFINDMIDLSRNSRLPVVFEKFDFEKFIEDTISSLSFYDNAPFIKIKREINYPFDFYTDVKRIEIIINNLISNAIKYHNVNQANPWIEIKVFGIISTLHFSIEDNGIGISNEHLQKIFDMFYRADHNSKGTGIGLYIVKETIIKLGGDISVSSAPNSGSIFEFTIPNKTL